MKFLVLDMSENEKKVEKDKGTIKINKSIKKISFNL